MRSLSRYAAAAALGTALSLVGCEAAVVDEPAPQERASMTSMAATTCADNPAPFDPSAPYEPDVEPADLRPRTTNRFFPLPVGARWIYQTETPDGLERGVVTVKPGSNEIWGTNARI